MIRQATMQDIQAMMAIYRHAKTFMDATDNPTQWAVGYPTYSMIEADIQRGVSFVCEDDGCIYGAFALIFGADPTYQEIEGAWHADVPYATIHRLASAGTRKGVFAECIAFAKQQSAYLRIDTHHDNHVMQTLIARSGFAPCGVIYIADGTPRLAYDYETDLILFHDSVL